MSPAETRRAALALQREPDALQRPDAPTAPAKAPADRADLRLVPRPRGLAVNRRRFLVALFIGAATAMSLALVTLHVLMAENQFRLNTLQQKAATEQESYEKLRLQVAQLEAPARIVWIAEGRLGMVQPASDTYLPAISASVHTSSHAATSGKGEEATSKAGPVSAGPNGSGPHASGPADRLSGGGSSTATGTAGLSGDADWPSIKPYLSGNP